MSEKLSRNRRIGFLTFVFLVLGFALALILPSSRGAFPAIASGMYTGSVTGLTQGSGSLSPLFVERLPDSNIFIVVIFYEGLRPQAVIADPLRDAAPEEPMFEPLVLSLEDRELTLRGKLHQGRLQGELVEQGKVIGSWELQPRAVEEIVAASPFATASATPSDTLPYWLRTKNDQRRLRREIRGLETELLTEQEKRKKLEGFVRDEKLLQQRAALRRDELAIQLREAVAARKKVADELQTLSKELDNLGNITRSGQAVMLARRVAHRENQWYLANWDEAGAVPVLDESLGIGTKIDYQKLEQQVRKANEIQAMLQELAAERAKSAALKRQLSGEVSGVDVVVAPQSSTSTPQPYTGESEPPATEPTPGVTQPSSGSSPGERPGEKQGEKKSLWDRIF